MLHEPSREAFREHGREVRFLRFAEIHECFLRALTRSLTVLSEFVPDTFLGRSHALTWLTDGEPGNDDPRLTTGPDDPTSDLIEPDEREPIVREPLGGASGTFEAMLEAAHEGAIKLPLFLGVAVVDEARLMQAALDHCQIFLERIETDFSHNVEYRAARALVAAASLQSKSAKAHIGRPISSSATEPQSRAQVTEPALTHVTDMAQETAVLLERAEAAIAEARRLAAINLALNDEVVSGLRQMRLLPRFVRAGLPTLYPQDLRPIRVSPFGFDSSSPFPASQSREGP